MGDSETKLGLTGAPLKPSVAYAQAIDSLVYRLSELMFGSLLAAYVLGFIGLLAANSPIHGLNCETVALIVQYLSVSLAYAYLTASSYVQYHAGILTMHQMPLARLGVDFLLALAQAVFFGLSMIFPGVFPSLLGVLLLASFFRQWREQKRLVRSLFRKFPRKPAVGGGARDEAGRPDEEALERRDFRAFRRDFIAFLKQPEFSELSVWKPVALSALMFAIFLCLAGSAVWYLAITHKLPDSILVLERQVCTPWIAIGDSLVAVAVSAYGHRILGKRASFLYNRRNQTTKMDDQFDKLVNRLSERS